MSMTQRYAGMLRRHSHEWDKQGMPVKAECLRQAARHMEELEQERDKAMRVVDLCQRADGRMIHSMRDYIEGMSVSVDVSTGEHDAHHRYFGTVTEVMDDPEDKHGVTLLVQDAKPNFSTVEKGSTQRVGTDLERSDGDPGDPWAPTIGKNLEQTEGKKG